MLTKAAVFIHPVFIGTRDGTRQESAMTLGGNDVN